jgi:hypothetical protein
MASMSGYAVVPPISPWDGTNRDLIELDSAYRTLGRTPAEAWHRHCQFGPRNVPKLERSRIIQHWHDRGYRIVPVRLEIMRTNSETTGTKC